MLDQNQWPKIIDFGISRHFDDLQIPSDLYQGTKLYCAPELLQKQKITPSIDVYAFGIVLYEIFMWPFSNQNFA